MLNAGSYFMSCLNIGHTSGNAWQCGGSDMVFTQNVHRQLQDQQLLYGDGKYFYQIMMHLLKYHEDTSY
jgi:hypothetical protein